MKVLIFAGGAVCSCMIAVSYFMGIKECIMDHKSFACSLFGEEKGALFHSMYERKIADTIRRIKEEHPDPKDQIEVMFGYVTTKDPSYPEIDRRGLETEIVKIASSLPVKSKEDFVRIDALADLIKRAHTHSRFCLEERARDALDNIVTKLPENARQNARQRIRTMSMISVVHKM